MLTPEQRDRIQVVLVSPRNPLNIGAVARAMANFGFAHLTVVSPYEPHWREAKSAVGSADLLLDAKESATLAEAVRDCTLVLGSGTLTHRKPEQPVIHLPNLAAHLSAAVEQQGRIAVLLGPEKHGLTRDDLSHCHMLVQIPTDPGQPSMNLGQAAAVILYEIAMRVGSNEIGGLQSSHAAPSPPAGDLDILASIIEEVMNAAHYSPSTMRQANAHDLRVMLRRISLNPADTRRTLGLFRRILWRIRRPSQ